MASGRFSPQSSGYRGRVIRAVIAQPPNCEWHMQRIAEAISHRRETHNASNVAAVTGRRSSSAHRFAVAAVPRKPYAQRLAVATLKLEAIGAPALVASCHGHLVVVSSLRARKAERDAAQSVNQCMLMTR